MGQWKDGVYYSDEEMQAIYNASPEGHYQNQINRRDKLYSSDTGGTKLPARQAPAPNIWNDPLVQLGGGGRTIMGGGMAYDQNRASADQWNSFSLANKQRAAYMIEAQKQGVPMSKIKEVIDRNMAMSKQGSQFTQPMSYGGSAASPSPQYTTSGNTSGYNIWKDKDVLAGRGNAAIKANQGDTQSSMVSPSLNPFENLWGAGETSAQRLEKTGGPPEGAWYDDLWKEAKGLGLKGWGELGLGAMKAYQGWQAAEMAEKQHGLARETFDFQKAAYNKDRQGRVLAYNTNAQNVNAWKEAQGRTDLNKLMV